MDFCVFGLGSNDGLARKIVQTLGVPLGKIALKTFADGEQHVQFLENVRGKNVFLVQSTNPPAEHWVLLLLAIDAARGASAREITAVIPYFGYARQDRKARPREPISARVWAETLEATGANRILTMDVHNDAIGGFFRTANVDYLYARPVFIEYLQNIFRDALLNDTLVVVSPDAGGVARAQSYAKRLMQSAELAIIHKERDAPNAVTRMKLIGDVKDKIALIIDDMVDTCGTLVTAADTLVANGAREVYACATHGLLSGNALAVLDKSPIKKIFITDTISVDRQTSGKIETISMGEVFGDAIRRIQNNDSLSALFEEKT